MTFQPNHLLRKSGCVAGPRHPDELAGARYAAGYLCRPRMALFWLVLVCPFWTGCAGFRPIDGLPARYLPHEFKAASRAGKQTINLSLLRQTPPEQYLLGSGDVLGVYIEGVLGRREEVPPVYFPENGVVPPSLGYPIPVRDDGTLSLPMIEPINVRGMTLSQAEETIREAYTCKKSILQPGRERILVSLQKPRSYRVLVIRQEAGGDAGASAAGGQGQLNLGVVKRGTGRIVDLPAYRNDVLHALAETGGLPGLDAENAIYIIRRKPPTRPNGDPARKLMPHPSSRREGEHEPPVIRVPEPAEPVSQYGMAREIGRTSATVKAERGWGHSDPPVTTSAFGDGDLGWGHSDCGGARTDRGYPLHSAQSYHANLNGGGMWSPLHSGNLALSAPLQQRGPLSDHAAALPIDDEPWASLVPTENATVASDRIVKIPIRLAGGETPQFTEEDIILQDGDVVFIESRETEIFYTGGLLGGGQYTLPRDYDLDVLGAISIAESQRNSGAGRSIGGVSALNQDVTISASDVIILRQLPNGTQVPIKVDLYEALRNPADRVVIQPGDYVILQYTRTEAILAFIERHLIEGALFGIAAAEFDNNGAN